MDKATRRQEGGFLSGGRLHPEAASGSASRITLALRRRACFLEREYGLSYSPFFPRTSEAGNGSSSARDPAQPKVASGSASRNTLASQKSKENTFLLARSRREEQRPSSPSDFLLWAGGLRGVCRGLPPVSLLLPFLAPLRGVRCCPRSAALLPSSLRLCHGCFHSRLGASARFSRLGDARGYAGFGSVSGGER